MKGFVPRLRALLATTRSPLAVGLDPTPETLPTEWRAKAADSRDPDTVVELYRRYLIGVLEACRPFAAVTKLQSAFFEVLGWRGVRLFEQCCREARDLGYLVLADAKRNDIGNTAQAYAQAFLEPQRTYAGTWNLPEADALTVTPIFGDEGNRPFLRAASEQGKAVFFIVRTSNPSSAQLQALELRDGRRFDQAVADLVEGYALETLEPGFGYAPVGAVVGATRAEELAELRARMAHAILLLPGVGAQGAALAPLAAAFDAEGMGALVPVSRGLLQAHAEPGAPKDWKEGVAKAAEGYARAFQQLIPAWS
ncbi:MAG: orotidine-5'-phosphate decarboxylase [Planctomycetes bacterium]|nr:orotidine-5'-phosphate decarboxylase [Planctomycetota bacterium]